MPITSADFDRVCTGDIMHIDYGSNILPCLAEDENPELPNGIDQAALRQSYAYAWAQTLGSEYGSKSRTHYPVQMHVLSAPAISVALAELSSKEVSCIGYQLSNDGKLLQEVVSSCTETWQLATNEVSSLPLCCEWRTMRHIGSQNAWCLLNTPGFTSYASNYAGSNLKPTLDAVMRLQQRAREDLMDPTNRFFLSKDSNEWLQSLNGTLLSTVQTSNEIDIDGDDLFMKLVAPNISAADFTPLSSILSDQNAFQTFLDLSSVSSMYEPLVQLDETSLLMEPRDELPLWSLQCAGHWDSVEKYTDNESIKTSADFISYIENGTGYWGYYPACPVSYYKYRSHDGYMPDGHGGEKTVWRDIDRTCTADCQICGYVDSISQGYDNKPVISAISFMDNQWMKQRKTMGVKSQKLLVMTANIKRQNWSDEDGRDHSMLTADVYADLIDMDTIAIKLSATVEDVVTAEDERCMLAEYASTLPHDQRVELGRRWRDYRVDLPPDGTLWREDMWSCLSSPAPVWDLLVSLKPALPALHPIVEYGDASSEAWTALLGCWAVTEIDSPLAGLLEEETA